MPNSEDTQPSGTCHILKMWNWIILKSVRGYVNSRAQIHCADYSISNCIVTRYELLHFAGRYFFSRSTGFIGRSQCASRISNLRCSPPDRRIQVHHGDTESRRRFVSCCLCDSVVNAIGRTQNSLRHGNSILPVGPREPDNTRGQHYPNDRIELVKIFPQFAPVLPQFHAKPR